MHFTSQSKPHSIRGKGARVILHGTQDWSAEAFDWGQKSLNFVICKGKGRKNLLGKARNARFNAVCGGAASAYLRAAARRRHRARARNFLLCDVRKSGLEEARLWMRRVTIAVTHRVEPRSAKRRKPINFRWQTPHRSAPPTATPGGGAAAAAAGRQDLAIEHTVFPYWNSVVMMGLRRPASAGLGRAVFVPELSGKTLAFVRGNSPQCFQLLAQAAVAATFYITTSCMHNF